MIKFTLLTDVLFRHRLLLNVHTDKMKEFTALTTHFSVLLFPMLFAQSTFSRIFLHLFLRLIRSTLTSRASIRFTLNQNLLFAGALL